MLGRPVIVTQPTAEPVSEAEMKSQLRILRSLTAAESTEIASMITAARKQVERYLLRSLITQTWDAFFDCWDVMQLPYGPVASVTSVKYYDLDGVQQTLSSSLYQVSTNREPAEVNRVYETTWPELQYGKDSPIVVRYVAGFGATGASVPEEIKNGIKLLATDLFETRGTIVTGTSVNRVPGYLTDLIHSYKIYQF